MRTLNKKETGLNPTCPLFLTHGADLRRFSRLYGKREGEILDFSSNVNPLGFPDAVRSVYREGLAEISKYPDPYASELCEVIAHQFRVSPECVIAGNGSLEILATAVRALQPKRVLLAEPCFSEYRRLAQLSGAKFFSVRLQSKFNFSFSLEKVLGHLNRADLVVLGHPNNPTGTALPREEMEIFLDEARRRKVFVILDEAFVDWTPGLSMASPPPFPSPLKGEGRVGGHFLIVRSLTKFYALAGIRSGFALGSKRMISLMKKVQGPWTCNRLAQRLSAAALQDSIFAENSRRWFQEESCWLKARLQNLGFKVYPSLANFFLVRVGAYGDTPLPLFESLGRSGIYVRTSEGFRGLGDNFFRIALKRREENEILIERLKEYVSAHHRLSSGS